MENIVERIVEICKQKKIPISKLEKDLGYGNGYLNPKKVSDMKAGRLFEILDYLDISVEEFFDIGTKQFQQTTTALARLKKVDPDFYRYLITSKHRMDVIDDDEFFMELQSMRDDPDFRDLMYGYKKMREDPSKVRIMKKFMKSLEEEEDDTIAD